MSKDSWLTDMIPSPPDDERRLALRAVVFALVVFFDFLVFWGFFGLVVFGFVVFVVTFGNGT